MTNTPPRCRTCDKHHYGRCWWRSDADLVALAPPPMQTGSGRWVNKWNEADQNWFQLWVPETETA